LGHPGKIGVLLLAHGSPDEISEIPEFLLRVTGGRPLPEESIEEIKQRYAAIGRSPLTALTNKQAELLSRELRLPVYVGMRNWKPFISDAVRSMTTDGIGLAVVICMAPQNSRTSVGLFRSTLALSNPPFEFEFVESWHDHPLLIKAFAQRLRVGLEAARRETKVDMPVIFTAHSVPQRTIAEGDPYETQAKQTATLVAGAVPVSGERCTFAFQSQGVAGGPWIGPNVEDTILTLAAKGERNIFIQPIGFLCDHVEILYDIDIAFKSFAGKQGIKLWRAESLNGSPLLAAALADIVRNRLVPFGVRV